MSIKGINVKESRGEINIGINVEDFIKTLQESPQKNGWVNIILKESQHSLPKGFTHLIRFQTPKPDGSTQRK
jgi:hypothetical protein